MDFPTSQVELWNCHAAPPPYHVFAKTMGTGLASLEWKIADLQDPRVDDTMGALDFRF